MAYIIDQKETALIETTGICLCCATDKRIYCLQVESGNSSTIVGIFDSAEEARDAFCYILKELTLHKEFIQVPKSKISERLNLDGTFRTD